MKNTPSITIYSIYCITNLVNQKKYVGFTSSKPENRFLGHIRKYVIGQAIQKYGKENFKFEVILQGLDRDHVLSMETHFINEYNTITPNGYNLTTGGEHFSHNLETRMKIGNSSKGRSHSNYTKNKISALHLGRIHSERAKSNMRRKYLVEDSNGKIMEILGISEFCKKHRIRRERLRKNSQNGRYYRGFKIIDKIN